MRPEGVRAQQMAMDALSYRHLLHRTILITEFAPILNRIISPPVRPVNKQIIKTEERTVLNRLVAIMISCGLRYELDRGEDGQAFYRLEPAIDDCIIWDGKRTGDLSAARFAIRHFIAGEVRPHFFNGQRY